MKDERETLKSKYALICSTEQVLNHTNRNNKSISINKSTNLNNKNRKIEKLRTDIQEFTLKIEKMDLRAEDITSQ